MGNLSIIRTRWAAIGAAVAITLGAGGVGIGQALTTSGEKPIFIPIEPCRLAFTTPGDFQVGPRTGPLGPGETYTLDGWGSVGNCSLPSGTAGLALNVTAVDATTLTNLRFFPAGTGVPTAANLNPAPGQPPTPNAVNVDLDGSGQFSVFNAFGEVRIVIDVVGYYDDHNHDDRYYTKAQTDAAIASADWNVSMPIAAAHWFEDPDDLVWNIASGGSDGPTGLLLKKNTFARFWHGFTLPPTYQAGTDVHVVMTWMPEDDNNFGCTFQFESNGVNAHRGGREYTGVAEEFADAQNEFIPDRVLLTAETSGGSWTGLDIQETVLILDGTELAPGDDIMLALNRDSNEVGDTCTQGMVVTGLHAEPA